MEITFKDFLDSLCRSSSNQKLAELCFFQTGNQKNITVNKVENIRPQTFLKKSPVKVIFNLPHKKFKANNKAHIDNERSSESQNHFF